MGTMAVQAKEGRAMAALDDRPQTASHGVRYEGRRTAPFGEPLVLLDPFGAEPDTESWKNRVR